MYNNSRHFLRRIKSFTLTRKKMTAPISNLSAETTWDPESNIPSSILSYIEDSKSFNKYTQLNFFFQLVSLLKQQKRTGWINMGIPEPESISDHMYRMSIMTMVLDSNAWDNNKNIDFNKCSKIALIHDIAESLVGDIVPHDVNIDKFEKSKREYKAILYICDVISKYNIESANEIKELWIDYELQRNIEATIVKDIDKFELLIQTFEYERLHKKRMDEFYSCRKVIKNIEIQNLADELISKRDEFLIKNNL
jgi:putative hydrolase of HD superfamily